MWWAVLIPLYIDCCCWLNLLSPLTRERRNTGRVVIGQLVSLSEIFTSGDGGNIGVGVAVGMNIVVVVDGVGIGVNFGASIWCWC